MMKRIRKFLPLIIVIVLAGGVGFYMARRHHAPPAKKTVEAELTACDLLSLEGARYLLGQTISSPTPQPPQSINNRRTSFCLYTNGQNPGPNQMAITIILETLPNDEEALRAFFTASPSDAQIVQEPDGKGYWSNQKGYMKIVQGKSTAQIQAINKGTVDRKVAEQIALMAVL